jgi:hypothetical protein
MNTQIEFKQVKNDFYGKPRYVCHFFNFADDYQTAVNIARKIGGKKYTGKDYGGGIVFQTFSPEALEIKINNLK